MLLDEIEKPPNNGSGGLTRKTYLTYDSLNRVTEVSNDISSSTRQTHVKYEFNIYGEVTKLIRLKEGIENSYSYTRDALGRVLTTTDPLQQVQTTMWESACPGRAVDTARGLRKRIGVDNLCRVSEIQVGTPAVYDDLDYDGFFNDIDNLAGEKTFSYDELGRLVRTTHTNPPYGEAIFGLDRYGSNVHTYLYDELDRLVKLTFEDGQTILWAYDAEGNVIRMTDPEGKVTEYSYYRDNLLHKVTIKRGDPETVVGEFVYSYDAAGRLETIQYPASTGITAVFRNATDVSGSGFDGNGNLRFLRYEKTGLADPIRSYEWTYDDSNNRQSMLDVDSARAVKWEYGYDWLDRLVTVKRAEAVDVASLPASPLGSIHLQREYVFDESDNRTFFDDYVNNVTYRYKYKSIDDNGTTRWSDQLEEILIYDTAAGHRTDGEFVSFEAYLHDADGNMTKRTIVNSSEEIDYTWDEFDRLKDVESSATGRMQSSRYDANGLRSRKLDKNGNSSVEYGAGISTSVSAPLKNSSSTPSISYIAGHMIVGAEIDGTFVFHLADALSTVRDVVDDTGAVIKSYEFDEYGNLLNSSGSGITSDKTWIGGLSVNDDTADSGMFNMGHRNYAGGVLGRFISRDPIGHRGGLNLYAYPTNPLSFVDYTGLDPDILGRDKWFAKPPITSKMTKCNVPPSMITIHESGESGRFFRGEDSAINRLGVQRLQKLHFSEGYGDIGYNFIITDNGEVFEGRSLQYEPAHVEGANPGNIGIVMLGHFGADKSYPNGYPLSGAAKRNLVELLVYLSDKYGIDLNRQNIKGHTERMEAGVTDCPGEGITHSLDQIVKLAKFKKEGQQ